MDNWQRYKIEASKTFQLKSYEEEVNELVFRERHGRCITLIDGTKLIEFISCSYLGLDLDPRVINASIKHIQACGVTFPAARTRARAERFVVLEELLNKIFCNANSVIFTSLHLGHLGCLPILGSGEMPSFQPKQNGFHFILDKTAHSSLQINRALLQQFGEVECIDFNNIHKLENSFKQSMVSDKTPVAIADSVGSMGGLAPIKLLFELAERYNGYIYLDDAHGTSVFGKHGCGYVLEKLEYTFHPRLILASSLAKAFGSVAGVIVVPTKEDAEILMRFSPTYIFGGPPGLAMVDAAIASAEIHLSEEIYVLQKKLQENLLYFDTLFSDKVINSHTLSPVRGILIDDEFKTIACTKELKKRGFAVTAAMYPVVEKKHAMLRLTFSSAHTSEQISSLCENLTSVLSYHS